MSSTVQPKEPLTLQPKESTPCSKSVIATASLAVISVVVFGLLAILVNAQVITLPSQLSVSTLLIAGGVGGAAFGIISIALRYCCSSTPASQEKGPSTTTPPAPTGGGGGGSTPITPDGSAGRTGAIESGERSTTSFTVREEKKKEQI